MNETLTVKYEEIEVNGFMLIVDFTFEMTHEAGVHTTYAGEPGTPPSVEYDNYQYEIVEIFGNGGEAITEDYFKDTTPKWDEQILDELKNYEE